jgi:hypothetical protein
MKKSEAATGAELQFTVKPTPGREFSIYNDGKGLKPTIAYIEKAMDDGAKVEIEPNGDVKITPAVYCGLLSNGDTRTTVLVREGYWDGVVSAAEADNVSVEEWLTNELAQRLEDTFYGRH